MCLTYEDIAVEFHLLDKDATYAAMAKVYRKYQLDREECIPLKERIKNNPDRRTDLAKISLSNMLTLNYQIASRSLTTIVFDLNK